MGNLVLNSALLFSASDGSPDPVRPPSRGLLGLVITHPLDRGGDFDLEQSRLNLTKTTTASNVKGDPELRFRGRKRTMKEFLWPVSPPRTDITQEGLAGGEMAAAETPALAS